MRYFVFFILLFISVGGFAGPAKRDLIYKESRTSDYYTFYYDRAVSEDGKRVYRIVTGVPKKAPGEKGYPALYATDGNAVLEMITEEQLAGLSLSEPPVIVAIGYETDKMFLMPSRTYDYTPARSDGREAVDDLDTSRMGGGADVFLNFIENTVFPLSVKRAFIDENRRTLSGHSYGGLFVLTAMSKRPGLFKNYVSGDPSLWWQKGDFFWSFMREMPSMDFAGSKLILLKGRLKKAYYPSPDDDDRTKLRKKLYSYIPDDALLMTARRLSGGTGIECEYREYGYLSHGPLFPVTLDAALSAASE